MARNGSDYWNSIFANRSFGLFALRAQDIKGKQNNSAHQNMKNLFATMTTMIKNERLCL
jgi:hypothetical protein